MSSFLLKVTAQDAAFSLQHNPIRSQGIIIPKDIYSSLFGNKNKITFTIYKDDFIKSISSICLLPEIHYEDDENCIQLSQSSLLEKFNEAIDTHFGSNVKSTFTIKAKELTQGNYLLYGLKQQSGLDIRNYLVEDFSSIEFIIEPTSEKALRFKTEIPKNLRSELTLITQGVSIKLPLQLIYYGAPGTGKSFAIDNLTNDENTVRTTFHPDSDYASFVGAYKPTMEDVPINSIYGESVQYATGKNGHPGTEKKIVYKYVPQAFLKAYVAAWSDLDNPHYLVIEEINRGNCAQIFGDLFQLLDRNSRGSSSYAIHADDDIRQFLATDSKGFGNLSVEQKQAIADFVLIKDNGKRSEIGSKILSGELLLLPPNLRIWATMNTSDQSLFPIDSAFKRRWNWHYVPIEYNKKDWLLHIGENYYRWGDFLRVINPIISELTESADKQMGYFFAKPDEKHGETTENNTISEDVFINKVLFYLWTDVLKDFDAGKEPFLNPDTKRAYEFSDFFDSKHDYLEQFVGKLNITPVANEDTESNTANTEEASKRIYGRSLVIKFPDGTVIKGDSQFDSYMQALEKIGLDKAAAVVEKKGYSRNQAPLISKEKHASIENSPTFSYVQNGDYYIIKGIDTMEGTLKGISKELELNLEVYFE